MDRLFCMLLLSAALIAVPVKGLERMPGTAARPVLFSMIFPQLIPEAWMNAEESEGVHL